MGRNIYDFAYLIAEGGINIVGIVNNLCGWSLVYPSLEQAECNI